MYYRLKYGKYYFVKIIILVIAAVLGELFIWWGMVREESVDWLAGQILHNPWPYAISEIEDGRIIVGNILQGFEITLPAGWQVKELKHPSFYLGQSEEVMCEVKSNIIRKKEEINVEKLLEENNGFINAYVGGQEAIKKEQTTDQGNFIYELKILLESDIVEYILFADKSNKYECRQDFEKIRRSFIYY